MKKNPCLCLRRLFVQALLILLCFGLTGPVCAEVTRVEVEQRIEVLGGQAWAGSGAYERISGKVFFAFDPDDPANGAITDLKLAPRNERGLVEASADLVVFQPKEPTNRRELAGSRSATGVAWQH